VAAARTARGPQRYTAVRAIWKNWDQTDPSEVERALLELAEAPGEPAAGAYASLLAAYARRRRGDLDGAKARIKGLGYVSSWLVAGPFDNEGRGGLARVYDPEAQLSQPLDMQRVFGGKERAVRWRTIPDAYPYAWVDFGDLLRPRDKICAYATSFVRTTSGQARAASVWVGASGAYKLFWNGEEVLADEAYRDLDADRMSVPVTLKAGWNQLTVKVCADESPPMMSVRLADPRGAPDAALQASAEPNLAEQAAKNLVKPRTLAGSAEPFKVVLTGTGKQTRVEALQAPPTRKAAGGIGPLQQFERAASARPADPAMLESYARYLLYTGGDDPTDRRARDLARRAADQLPTIERLLLVAGLSEDRNLEREWLERAVKLAPADDVRVLLAQARLARRSPNWRDAVPFFDRVLKLDPDNTEATLGRVDLYNEAGLKRTALGVLERAIERKPRAISLLSAYAAQLSSLERQAESDEIADRYSAFRFDDNTWQAWRLRLAVARRDKAMAEHWIGRMLATDPGSAHALGVAARAYWGLGMADQALQTFERALALAPEDTDTMKEMAGVLGELGRRAEQIALLRKILVLRPQFKDVREYLEHIEPPRPRTDEAYAWEPDKFMGLRAAPAGGFNQRTLRNLQVTTVYESGLSSRFYQVVFQPMTDEAAASAREYAFAYQADRQQVQLRAGKVYRSDGRIDQATESNEGPADNPEIAMYTSARTYFVQFPRINVGDIVELRYRIDDVTAQNAFADYFGEAVFLQSSAPVFNAEYVVIAPKSRPLFFSASPFPSLTREDKDLGDSRLTRFSVPAIPPILPEPNMPPWSEVLGHVHVSTYRSWDEVGRWYWGLAKDQLVPDNEVRAVVDRVTQGLGTEQEKVRAIYNYVVQRTRYVALEFGIYGYKPRRASQTFARGWGDCKDKAALIVTMCRVAGIPASMVLVRSGLRGDFPSEPASLAPFDHAIAYVPSLDLYLDGTAQWAGSNELPTFDRGALALVVDEKGARLVHLPDPPAEQSRRVRNLEAAVAANGSATIDLKFEATGAFAAQWRDRYHGAATRRDRVLRDLTADLTGFELAAGAAGLETGNLDDIEQPARLHLRGKAPAFGRKDGDELAVPITAQDRFVSALVSLSQRKQDIKLSFQSTIDETWTVKVPPGMTVKSVPSPASRSTDFGDYELTAERKEGAVVVRSRVSFRKTRIRPAEYAGFVAFCEELDRTFGQRLVLGKK
jgi:tetratricopeptide (TPR) repeat protein